MSKTNDETGECQKTKIGDEVKIPEAAGIIRKRKVGLTNKMRDCGTHKIVNSNLGFIALIYQLHLQNLSRFLRCCLNA